jgi:hypothetical protein
VRHPSVAARGGDRAVVERGVRLLRGLRRVRVRVEPDAAEEEPRCRGAPARKGTADRGSPHHGPRRAPRPSAHLQQGPPGGQGAAVRRDRHAGAVPQRGRRDAARDGVRPRAHGRCRVRRVHRGDGRGRPPGAARGPVQGGPRHRGRARARRGRARQAALRAHRGGAPRARSSARQRLLRAALRGRVARVEGLRGRHFAGTRPGPARPGAPRARGGVE